MKLAVLILALALSGCMIVEQKREADGASQTRYTIFNYDLKSSRFLIDNRPTTQRTFVNTSEMTVDRALIDAISESVFERFIKAGLKLP